MKQGLSQKKLKTLFNLLDELYCREQKRSGMTSQLPCVFAKWNEKFMAYSPHGVTSESMEKSVSEWAILEDCKLGG